MAHINTTTVQTAEGAVEVTKTSTHRDYVVASVATYKDGTQSLLSWHLTTQAAAKFIASKAAHQTATYNERHHGGSAFTGFILAPVTVTLTGKDKAQDEAPAAVTAEDAPAIVVVRAESGTTGNTCRCGCGEAIGTKSQYRPGHDARHAGAVARDLAASAAEGYERTTADSDLGSDALRAKAYKMAERLTAKAAAK